MLRRLMEALVGRLLRVYMRERSKEERRESGYKRRTFSARRREDDLNGRIGSRDGRFRDFSTTKFRGLMVVVLLDSLGLCDREWRKDGGGGLGLGEGFGEEGSGVVEDMGRCGGCHVKNYCKY
ncbi:hypothetical protein OIU74_026000 [Salix koriyanagi]|uniref:Uncharacterized protein n=1 Tax=Salix koriyanagi TaxID=2511006 RepID=A0A9Q0W2Z2_9ROSI|nr:hypothetical protein OIU74_026000 [Salix koriyanagi]